MIKIAQIAESRIKTYINNFSIGISKLLVDGDKKTLCQIYSSLKKRRGKSKYLLSVVVKLYNKDNETLDARIVYVRDRNNKKNRIALISTDMDLTEEEIIQRYGKRWNVMPISALHSIF